MDIKMQVSKKKVALQMFYEEANVFDKFIRLWGDTQFISGRSTNKCFTGKLHGVPLIVILLISKIIESSTVPVAQF